MDQIFGLPAHPLFVHMPIVLIPLLALVSLAFVFRPAWRPALSIPTAVLAVVTLVGTLLAANSGESLKGNVNRNALVRAHVEQGDQLKSIGILFGFAVLGLIFLENSERLHWSQIRLPAQRQLLVLASVAAILMATVATVWDVRAGHSGAKAVWSEPGRLQVEPVRIGSNEPSLSPSPASAGQ